jgi:peptidoglycan/LPS O-acetylase OafA/YrhL
VLSGFLIVRIARAAPGARRRLVPLYVTMIFIGLLNYSNFSLGVLTEPLRESCMLQSLRGWSHVKHVEEVRAGGS